MIRLLLSIVVIVVATAVPAIDYTNEAAFKAKFTADVVTHYSSAIDSYNSLLVALNKQLANYDPNNLQSLLKPIDPASTQASSQFLAQIKIASANANQMVKEIDAQMTDAANKVSQVNAQITALNTQIKNTQVQITGSQNQVNVATQALSQAEANLATHQRALQDAQNRLNDARKHCLGRKKRGWLKHIVHEIEKPIKKVGHVIEQGGKEIMKGICQTINVITRQIDQEKGAVNQANANLNNARAQRDQAAGKLANQQAQLHNQQVALQAQQAQLGNLQVHLKALQVKRDQINSVDQKMKVTLAFIDSMVARGQVMKFNVDIGYLLNVNSIVGPLAEIGKTMATLSGQPLGAHFLPSLTNAKVVALKQKVDAIVAHAKSG